MTQTNADLDQLDGLLGHTRPAYSRLRSGQDAVEPATAPVKGRRPVWRAVAASVVICLVAASVLTLWPANQSGPAVQRPSQLAFAAPPQRPLTLRPSASSTQTARPSLSAIRVSISVPKRPTRTNG